MIKSQRKFKPFFRFFKISPEESSTKSMSEPEDGFVIEESDDNVIEIEESTTDIFIPESSLKDYELLGLDEDVSNNELKKRYRLLAKKNHPDNGGNPKKFMKIQKAYKKIMKHRSNLGN
jgi:DnaJ-class molecular chaperone